MGDRGIRWGWQIRCMTEGCPRKHEQWGDPAAFGPPPLPGSGSAMSGPLAGWFISSREREYRNVPDDHSRGHLAYCPEHSAMATEWQARFAAWQAERNAVGRDATKAVEKTLAEALADWLAPNKQRQEKLDREIGKTVWAWREKHPPPKPPWRT
jgi:hypothetical protein